MPKHQVEQGECLASIAKAKGFLPDTLWNAPENAALREKRTGHVLSPGDELFIPEKKPKEVTASTGSRHVFKVRNRTTPFELRLQEEGAGRSGLSWKLKVGALELKGKTDGSGTVRATIPADATGARLEIGDGGDEIYDLKLGELDPIGTDDGVKIRLQNLGYCDPDSGDDDALKEGITRFQQLKGLEATGTMDDATRNALRDAHGS